MKNYTFYLFFLHILNKFQMDWIFSVLRLTYRIQVFKIIWRKNEAEKYNVSMY